MAEDFTAYLRGTEGPHRRFVIQGPSVDGDGTILDFAWFEAHLHRLRVSQARAERRTWMAQYLGGSHGYVSNARLNVHDWLASRPFISSIRWYSEVEWAQFAEGRETPW